ncbi:MAG: circularly permuted type 2 ATP-grasp protein [Actinomycetota bacterium]
MDSAALDAAQAIAGTVPAAQPAELSERRRLLDRLLAGEGAGFIVHDLPVRSDGRMVASESRPWPVDPLPYRLSAADFAWIEGAVSRRMAMLDAILHDLYGDRRLVAEGVVDPALLWGSARYRLAAASGWGQPAGAGRWLTTYAADIARTEDGVWFLVGDHTDGPVGLGYSLLNRGVMSQVVGTELDGIRSLDATLDVLRRGLVDTSDVDGPRVAVFTGGIDHPAYVEHSYLATTLGFNLVEGSDLVVRDRRLWLQTLGGLEEIDVLYRLLPDAQLDPLEANARGSVGVPAVLLAASAGSLTIANAHGAGLVEDEVLRRRWDDAGMALLDDDVWLRCPPQDEGLTPGRRSDASRVAPDVSGVDAWLGRRAERVPIWNPGTGRLEEAPIVLRIHAVATDDGIVVVPSATGRVLRHEDDPWRPTTLLAKDVWVEIDVEHPAPPVVVAARHAPQVDLITSVPTRAADSLYWLGRAAERAEVVARACRVVATDRSVTAMHLLDALTGPPAALASVDPADHDPLDELGADEIVIASAASSLDFHVGSVLAEASGVREFLSATAGRVLAGLNGPRRTLADRPLQIDAIDDLLTGLSALAGLWSESVVRGPAWYFGDFARRYERAVVALTSAATSMRCGRDPRLAEHERRHGLEAVLAANDSLVAYRRRHRSDVELGTVLALSLLDERNPRSARASLLGLERNATSIGWEPGATSAVELRARLDGLAAPAECELLIEELHELAARLHATELTAPPHPMLFRSAVTDPGAVA